MADGRSLVAALSLGADGINMGTRFIATREAPVHENVKQALVAATELDTRAGHASVAQYRTRAAQCRGRSHPRKERTLGADIRFDDIVEEVAGVYPRIMKEGALDAGAWSCGLVVGLIRDIPTVKELVDRIVSEATEIIRSRLAGVLV